MSVPADQMPNSLSTMQPPDLSALEEERKQQVSRRDEATDEAVRLKNEAADKELANADAEEQSVNQLSTMQPPVNHMQEVMKGAPFLMMLAAVGGSLTKSGGMAMLSGMTGMMNGLHAGAKQQYDEAYQQFETNYTKTKDLLALKEKIFNERLNAYKGRADAQVMAAKAADNAVGDIRQQEQDILRNWHSEQTLAKQLDALAEQVRNHKENIDIRQQLTDLQKQKTQAQISRWKSIDAGKVSKASDAVEQIDGLIADLEQAKASGKWIAGTKGSLARVWESLATNVLGSDDTSAHDFQAKMSALLLRLPKLLTGSSKSAKDERARVENIVNGLQTGSSPDIALNDLKILRDMLSKEHSGTEEETKTLGGKTYVKKDGKWYEQ